MDHEKKLIELYKKTIKSQQFFAEKGWESIKFHILLSSSLVSITIGALVAMHTSSAFNELGYGARGLLVLILVVLPSLMIAIIELGYKNFVRECKRMYEQSSIFLKLEEKLGFWEDRDEDKRKGFPNEEKYFPDRYREYFTNEEWSNSEDFIKDIMSRKDTLFGIMKKIFIIFEDIGLILIVIISLVAILHLIAFF